MTDAPGDAIARLVAALEAGPTPGEWTFEEENCIFAEQPAQALVQPLVAHLRDDPELNGPFIAACREGVPALLARVAELEQAFQKIEEYVRMNMNDPACKPADRFAHEQDLVIVLNCMSKIGLAASGTGGER